MVGDTWSPTASMRTLKYFLADAAKHKARVNHIYFIGAFLQAKVKNRVFVKLDIRYADYFPEYAQYFGRTLKYLLADASKHKARVHQLYFIGAFLQANVKNRVFVMETLGPQQHI